MLHHNSRRLAGSALLGVPWRCSATSMLASLDVHRSQRCSQDSQRWQALAGVGSHNVQQQLAQVAEPWGGPLHPITISCLTYRGSSLQGEIHFDNKDQMVTDNTDLSRLNIRKRRE